MREILPDFMNKFFDLLATPIISNSIITLQWGWLIIHFTAGAILLFLLRKEKYKWLWLFIILVLFEVFEFTYSYMIPLIEKEVLSDTIWDIIIGLSAGPLLNLIIGMIGGGFMRIFLTFPSRSPYP